MCTIQPYKLTYSQLLADIHTAYYDARRHKRNKPYQQKFEANLEHNLSQLCYELWTRSYKPRPSTCFIIADPKKREVFAAEFRDRIVHHLYYNYTHEMFERTFIQDSYSCIKGRGTHYGIRRLEHHIRQESQNYKERCYVLKMDVRGYFMNISRQRLLEICNRQLTRMMTHRIDSINLATWQEVVDMDFVFYLTREIVMLNPVECCRMKGDASDWNDLPHDKSLFHSAPDCGLPIGNLTSQLFSNVYMNELDQFMKRTLHCKHYGRYVDDFFVVSCDRRWLLSLIDSIRSFVGEQLGLSLHEGKTLIVDVRYGVEFLGAYLKPWRMYLGNKCLKRMKKKIVALNRRVASYCPSTALQTSFMLRSSLNSFLGVMSHYKSRTLRTNLMLRMSCFSLYGRFNSSFLLFTLFCA